MSQSFFELIDQFNTVPDQHKKTMEEKLWKDFGIESVVFILDMSGFTTITQRYGLIHYLAMIRTMQVAAGPIIERYRGSVVKFEADNLYARFTSSVDAVNAGVAINVAFEAMNTIIEDSSDIHVSIGIAKGKILNLDGKDMFGDAVNIASKLGEDAARGGEILVTADIHDDIPLPQPYSFKPVTHDISGSTAHVYSVVY
jgi:class 3 adenylate cyclase